MPSPEIIGRYALYGKIAQGGMATVHIGRLLGPVGFTRTVAIKRMHPQFTGDPEFVSMFLDEARLAARIRHPNVVSTLDVVAMNGELFLVLDYVQGETLSVLMRRAIAAGVQVPVPIAAAVASGVLHGLHAAHEAKNEQGEPLGIVHRDISPQNVMVGIDGVSRVLDFGVAKAAGRLQTTESGRLKGKLAYMPPEQVRGKPVTRRCDVYAAAVVLWEALAGRRLFQGENEAAVIENVLRMPVPPPSQYRSEVPHTLDAVVLRGLSRDPSQRFATAREMATALEGAVPVAIAPVVGAWVDGTAADTLSAQAATIAAIESASDISGSGSGIDAKAFVDIASASRQAGAYDSNAQTMARPETSASKASAISVPLTVSRAPRTRALVVGAAVAALAIATVVMARRAPVSSEPAVAAVSAKEPPSVPATAPAPPPTGSVPEPSAEPPPSTVPSAAQPVVASAAPPTPRAKSPGRSPAREAPKASPVPQPPPSATPAYNPLDHI